MQKSIYLYLQRYLLKVLTKPPHYNRNTFLAAHKINNVVKSKKWLSLKLNLLRKYTKKNVCVNCVRFYLVSHFFFINNQFLKKLKRQKSFYLSFINSSSIHFIYTIKILKIQRFNNKQEVLYKGHFSVSYSNEKLLTLLKRKNFNLNTSVDIVESLPFYFYNNQALNSFIYPCYSIKIDSLSVLRRFYNFYFFLSKNSILNRKKDLLCNLFSIAFPLLIVSKIPSTANQYGLKFLRQTLTVIHIFCFVTLQYFKEKKPIQNTQYNVFVDLVTILYVCQFNQKSRTKVKIKPFYKKIVVIKKTVNSHYFLLRPLFSLTRFDTFFICQSLRLPMYPDQSNCQVDFLRNRIRKQILPTIRILINPKFDTILCKFNEFYA